MEPDHGASGRDDNDDSFLAYSCASPYLEIVGTLSWGGLLIWQATIASGKLERTMMPIIRQKS